MRFAFYGRVSTDDAQDPSLSIPRQLASCKGAIEPAAGDVVAHYWDVESGRKGLAPIGAQEMAPGAAYRCHVKAGSPTCWTPRPTGGSSTR